MLVKKSNNLVESKYKFDIWETRFFLFLLSQIRREDTEFEVYRVRYKDIIKIFSLKSGDSYALLRDASKSLMGKSVKINYEENGVLRTRELHLIKNIDYLAEGQQKGIPNIVNHEYIDVTIEPEMKPFLLQLSQNFTAYDLRNVIKLSVYALRMYELLKQYESIGMRTLSIDDIKEMFQVEKQYKLYADFYRWVIKPSEIEINKHTDLLIIDIEKLKEGRKITALRFKFRLKTAQELSKIRENSFSHTLFSGLPMAETIEKTFINDIENVVIAPQKTEILPYPDLNSTINHLPEDNIQEKLIGELFPIVVTQFGVSAKMFISLVEQYAENVIREAVIITEKAIKTGKVEQIAGFFVEAVRSNYKDVEQQKKHIDNQKMTDKKAKELAIKQDEQNLKQQKEALVRHESQRKIAIIRRLIEQDSPIIHQAIEQLKMGQGATGYNPKMPLTDLLENPMMAGKLMNILQKIQQNIFIK